MNQQKNIEKLYTIIKMFLMNREKYEKNIEKLYLHNESVSKLKQT